MNNFRKAYLSLDNDDARRAFARMHMQHAEDFPDGAFTAFMAEAFGDNWIDELIRLGLLEAKDAEA